MSQEGYTNKAIQELKDTAEYMFISATTGAAAVGGVTYSTRYWEHGILVGAMVTLLVYGFSKYLSKLSDKNSSGDGKK